MLGIHHHVTTGEAALAVSAIVGLVTAYNVRTGTRHARWQRERDAERRETRMTFAFEHSSRRIDDGGPYIVASAPAPPPPSVEYRLRVVVVNASETGTVWIRGVDLEQLEGEQGVTLMRDGATRLEPGEPLALDFYPQRYDIDFSRGLVIHAHLAPDHWVSSEPEFLLGDLLERTSGTTQTYAPERPTRRPAGGPPQ